VVHSLSFSFCFSLVIILKVAALSNNNSLNEDPVHAFPRKPFTLEWKILKQDILLKQQDMESKQLLVEGVIAAAAAVRTAIRPLLAAHPIEYSSNESRGEVRRVHST
jgi:hypothetical protein